ncbi:MAG: translation initiation factor IF-2 [Tepidisphaerales bacterium]
MSLGLAATVREWYAGGGGAAVAVEQAPAPEAAVEEAEQVEESKHKRSHRKKKPEDGEAEAHQEEPAAEVEVSEVEKEKKRDRHKAHVEAEVATAVVEPAAEAPVAVPEAPAEPPVETLEAAPPEPVAIPTEPVVPPVPTQLPTSVGAPPAVAATAPVPAAPAHAPHPAHAGKAVTPVDPRTGIRAAVTLESRAAQQVAPTKKAVVPSPRHVPAPAKIMGPRVVREEKPDIVSTPRRRPTPAENQSAPSFVQARAQGGRGVKTREDEEDEKKAAKSRTLSSRRRGGLDGRRGEAEAKLKEFSEADLEERRIRLGDAGKYAQGLDRHLKKSAERGTHGPAKSVIERGEAVRIEEPITVRSLAAALGLKTNEVQGKLIKKGIMAAVNQTLDTDTAAEIALDYNIELKVTSLMTLEEQLEHDQATRESEPENLRPRPPVVAILGHVDHGKTSLLDKIRQANVAAGEAGGITQHIAAWMVTLGEGDKQQRVTFIDTPGHQAFTSMRARGANMTDVVVLVVSAAEGVQPQTIESINHARAAGVPIVVALNKMDRADANPEMVLGQLAAQELSPPEYGGTTEIVRCSAATGQGIPELIEILDLQSQLLELKSDPTEAASGSVIEARMDEGLGPVATVLVQAGTLKVGDVMLAGQGYGRVRNILNDRGGVIEEATASMPVIVSGMSSLPAAGDRFYIVDDIDHARSVAEERAAKVRQAQLAGQNRATVANFLTAVTSETESKTINLIIKTDVQGSAETLVNSVTNMNTAEVKVRVIHSGVGTINESDVELAIATKTKPTDNRVAIIGFQVVPDDSARALAEHHHIDIKTYRVIYEIFDDLKKSLSGMLTPEIREKLHGHAEIRHVYKYSKVGNIAGCMVTDGHIQRGSKIRLIRDGKIIIEDGTLESLRRVKDDVKEVKSGFECGLKIANYDDIKQGDRVEAYSRETIERTL